MRTLRLSVLPVFLFFASMHVAVAADSCVPTTADGYPFPQDAQVGMSCELFKVVVKTGTCEYGDDDHGITYGPCQPESNQINKFEIGFPEIKADIDYVANLDEKTVRVTRRFDHQTCERSYNVSLSVPCAAGTCMGTGTSDGQTGPWKYDVTAQALIRDLSPGLPNGTTLRYYVVCLERIL